MLFKCPICGKKVSKPVSGEGVLGKEGGFFPFCSQRCRLVDLGDWLESEYKISCDDDSEKQDEGEL